MKTLSLSRRLLAAALVAAFAATPALASKDRDRHPAPPPQQHNNAHRPPAPPQYRYASVAGDILLLAIGTNMVIDALDNLFD